MYKLCYNLYYSRYGASKSNPKSLESLTLPFILSWTLTLKSNHLLLLVLVFKQQILESLWPVSSLDQLVIYLVIDSATKYYQLTTKWFIHQMIFDALGERLKFYSVKPCLRGKHFIEFLIRRRRSLREMEQRRVKKKSGLFRSVSSLSTSSRRNQTESENERENNLERIRLSIGRRSVDDFSNHPISVSCNILYSNSLL